LSAYSNDLRALAALKFDVLAKGAILDSATRSELFSARKDWAEGQGSHGPATPILRTRSGVSGGLDVVLADSPIFINIPVNELFATYSEYRIYVEGGKVYIASTDSRHEIYVLPEPAYYHLRTEDKAEPLSRIGQMCSGDRLCYGMTGPGCSFWPRDQRCKYCSIGNNYSQDASKKSESYFLQVLEKAVDDPVRPAFHLLIGGGTPPGEDMGASTAARLTERAKSLLDISVYVMIAAPLRDVYIDMLYESGVDELGMNLEFWSEPAWERYIPGKLARIGKDRYLRALERAADLFGPQRARSIIIAGLESRDATLDAVSHLVSIGVMPIISPFRPLDGTPLGGQRGFDGAQYLEIYEEAQSLAVAQGLVLGPTCIACQSNTLALPLDYPYKDYRELVVRRM
jgi:hypothetical protein